MRTPPMLRKPWVTVPMAILLLLLTFLVVYFPAGALSQKLQLSANAKVPVTILVTFVIACVLMGWHIHRGTDTLKAFGFQWPAWSYLGYTLILAVPFAVLAAWFTGHAKESAAALAGLHLTTWQIWLYFVVAAAIQEETIFRGLLQSTLARRLAAIPACSAMAAVFCVALLFGLIHLVVGPVTALFAFILSLIAGELRRRSGSLLPAIVCHSIFNLAGILWALR